MEPVKWAVEIYRIQYEFKYMFRLLIDFGGKTYFAKAEMSEEFLHQKEIDSALYAIDNVIRIAKKEFHSLLNWEEVRTAFLELLVTGKSATYIQPAPKSNHATGPAMDFNIGQLGDIWSDSKATAKDIYDAMAKIDTMINKPIEADTHYRDMASSEFEGVEGLDESLWAGEDGLT